MLVIVFTLRGNLRICFVPGTLTERYYELVSEGSGVALAEGYPWGQSNQRIGGWSGPEFQTWTVE